MIINHKPTNQEMLDKLNEVGSRAYVYFQPVADDETCVPIAKTDARDVIHRYDKHGDTVAGFINDRDEVVLGM